MTDTIVSPTRISVARLAGNIGAQIRHRHRRPT